MPRSGFVVLVCLLAGGAALGAQKVTVEQVVKQHLDSFTGGTTFPVEVHREVRGTAATTTPAKAAGQIVGPFRLTSTPRSSKWTLKFESELYEGEDFSAEGDKVEIGFGQPRTNSRSALGTFVAMHRVIVAEGLYGGVLNARWPLLNLEARGARLNYDGVKKLSGRDLHRVRYRGKGQGDLEIHLYFDRQTFQHVATTYNSTRAQQLGASIESSSQQSDQFFRLEERFGQFRKVGNLTLPSVWSVRYERSGNTSNEWKYDMKVESVDEGQVTGKGALPTP